MDKETENYELSKHDLRALLHWANFGVLNARGGSYLDIREIIQKHANLIKFHIKVYEFKK